MNKQVVITGVGLVSSLGQNLTEVVQALVNGQTRREVTEAYPPGQFRISAPLPKIDFSSLLGSRGLRYYSISTLMLTQACLLALHDAGLYPDQTISDISLIAGSALGNHGQSTRYLRMISRDGPGTVMPMDGVDTASNSSVDFAAIRLNARGPVKMVSTGSCSSTDAIIEAAQQIDWNNVHTVVVAGFEKLYPEMVTTFAQRGCLGPDHATMESLGRPYDQGSQGLILGEGAAAIVLEQREVAEARKARVRGRVLGGASLFNPATNNSRMEHTLAHTIVSAIEEAGCTPAQIDWVCGSSGGIPAQDRLELLSLRRVFLQTQCCPAVSSLKAAWGDTFGASGALAAAAVLGCMEASAIPATIGLEMPWPEARGLDLIVGSARTQKLSRVLITSHDASGFCSSLVLGGPQE